MRTDRKHSLEKLRRPTMLLVSLVWLAGVACTSTEDPPAAPSVTRSPDRSIPAGSDAHGVVVFNRATPDGITVVSLDLDTGTERPIRDVEDFVTLSPDGSRFLGASVRPDGKVGPETFDIDGSGYGLLPIDDETLQVGVGVWSPDGTRVVAGAWDETDPSRGGLYTFGSTDAEELERVTEPETSDQAVAYSPDGSRILFLRAGEPDEPDGTMHVLVVATDGSGTVRLDPPGTTSGFGGQSWSPDGRQVAIVASKGDFWHGSNAVFVVDADGTHARRITPWNDTLSAQWSPDGNWIALDMSDVHAGLRDLFVVHPDGSELTRVTSTEDGRSSFAPTWSPDGRALLFARREIDDRTNLWVVNADGSAMSQVTDSPAEYSGYRWLRQSD